MLLQLRVENRNFKYRRSICERAPAAQAGKSQLSSTNLVRGALPRSSGWRIATFKYKRSTRSTPPQLRQHLRRATCAESLAQSNLQLAQSNCTKHLRRATCTDQLAQSTCAKRLHGATGAEPLRRATCSEHLRRATCTEQAQSNLHRPTCADMRKALARSNWRRALAQSNLLRALAQSNLHRALARSSLQRATCAQQPGTMQLAQTTFVRNRAAQFERKVG